MDIREKISNLPNKPGVYLMKDRLSRIIYIGKSSKLKARVATYFRSGKKFSFQKQTLIDAVTDLDCIVTDTEVDALLLEPNLIKQYQPKYNVSLKDDKSYPCLKLTTNEDFPRLFITRKRKEDGAAYYGPYTDVKLLRKALALMRKIFPLRKCRSFPKKPCLDYYLRQCLAPCIGRLNAASYNRIVKEVVLFLEGKRQRLIDELTARMNDASAKSDFEETVRIRDRIEALSRIVRKSPKPDLDSEPSALDRIKGVGPLRKRELINYFGSVDKIRRARVERLLKVDKIDRITAREIVDYFRNDR